MTPTSSATQIAYHAPMAFIKQEMLNISDQLLASLPSIEQLTSEARRGIIARYSAVLEGNFIYWMTGAYLSAKTHEARAIIEENLLTEVRDCHPGMLRRFALAAYAVPSDLDTLAVYPRLSAVRHFVGRLSAVPLIAMMAFFENFIQGFMEYLAKLATRQGSEEMEYTDVHGVCDIEHSEELFHALQVEMEHALDPHGPSENLFEGVYMLRDLIRAVISSPGIFKNVN